VDGGEFGRADEHVRILPHSDRACQSSEDIG
jgi:hypothetical protein